MGEFNINKSDGSLEQTAGMPSEYPATQVMMSDDVTSVEDALDEVVADAVKVYNNSYTTESIAPDTTKTVTVTLPPSYNTILAVIPYSCSPNSSWESYPIVKTVTHATGAIQFRIIGSGSAQTYTIRYTVLYK